MIRNKNNPVFVKNFFCADFTEPLNGNGGRDIISKGNVNPCIDQITSSV